MFVLGLWWERVRGAAASDDDLATLLLRRCEGACLCPSIPCPPSTSPVPTPWHHPLVTPLPPMLLFSPCFPAF
jgi:hypothetical protein